MTAIKLQTGLPQAQPPNSVLRAGAYDPRTDTLYLAAGGHFDGMARAGGTPHPGLTPGITTLETDEYFFWANDSMSLPLALNDAQRHDIQKALEALFPMKKVIELVEITEALQFPH